MESLGLPAVTFRDGTTACIQEAVKGEKLIEGQVIEFEDGTTAYIHQVIVQKEPVASEDAQPVVLEYGSVTYINNTAKESLDPREAVQLEDGSTAYTHHPVIMPPGSAILAVKTEAGLEEVAREQEKEDAVKTIDTLEQYPRKDLQEKEVPSSEKEQQISSRAFQCRYPGCGRFYAAAQNLKVHERAHTGEKPYTCDFPSCGKAFATGCGLRSHSRTHTGEKPYKCPEEMCSKAFRSSGDLHKHIRTHTGERPFKCHFVGCGLSFTTSNILKIHIRRHTGERPYMCSEPGCGRSFSSSTNYKNHIRIHTGEKPYLCPVRACGKRFTEYSSLHKHQVVHSHCKPYPCSSCGKAYKQSSTLAAHRFSSHGELEATQDRQQLLAADTGFPLKSQYIAFLSEMNEEEEKDAMPTQVSFTSQDKTEQVTIVTSGAVMSEESAITALQQQEGALLVTTNGNYIILQLQEQQSLEEAISMTTGAVPPDPVKLEAAVSESGC